MTTTKDVPRIGVDVGGTTLRVGIVEHKRVVWEHRHTAYLSRRVQEDAPQAAVERVLGEIETAVRVALDRRPDVAGVGLAVPGFLAPNGRLVRSPNLPGLADVDLVAPLVARLDRPVVVENDALAAAWGEWSLHPDAPDSLLYVGLGPGVGGGLVLDGEPYRGQHGFAMEIGHVIVERDGRLCGCGNRGCLEQYASATGVRESYRERTGQVLEAHEIADRAHEGDRDAREALERASLALATVLAHAMKLLDVTDVVIGGGLSGAWNLLRSAFERRLEHDLIPALRGRARTHVSTSGDQAGMLGAALLSAHRLERPEGGPT